MASRFFLLGFSVRQDYSTHFEPSQGVKMRDPQEKTMTTRKQNLAYLSSGKLGKPIV